MRKFVISGVYLLSVLSVLSVFSCSTKSQSASDEDIRQTDADTHYADDTETCRDFDNTDENNDLIQTDMDVEQSDQDERCMADDEYCRDFDNTDEDVVETDMDTEKTDSDVEKTLCEDAICVSVDGNDITGTGSQTAPYKTITKAIDVAESGKEICVSAGNYPETLVITKDNITIKGGFTPIEWKRNSTYYSNNDSLGALNENNTKIISAAEAVITFDGTLSDMVFEGFTVESTCNNGYSSSAITVKSGNPNISHNTLTGGNPTGGLLGLSSGSMSVGITILAGSPHIHNNKIMGGEAIDTFTKLGKPTAMSAGIIIGKISSQGADSTATPEIYSNWIVAGHSKDESTNGGNVGVGVYKNTGSVKIHSNVIRAGNNKYPTKTYGVLLSKNTGVVLYNNIVEGGTGTGQKVSIYLYDVTTAKIYNNTLDGGTSTTTTAAIKLSGSFSTPEIKNNLLFCGSDIYNPVYEYNANQTTPFAPVFENNVVVGGNTGVSLVGGQNTSDALYKTASNIYLSSKTVADIGFVNYTAATFYDKDFHLTEASKNIDGKNITTAGEDLSTVFTVDKDGVARTTSWSVGAYELD